MQCYTILYARKSREEDDRQTLSLDAQEGECRRHAEREGIEINQIIREAHSAKQPGRPLFDKMMRKSTQLLKLGQRVQILCHKPDRLLRNLGDWAHLNELMESGLNCAFVSGTYSNNAQGKMAFGINVLFAKYYVDNLAEEVRKGLREKIARGEWPCWAPFGYRNSRDASGRATIVMDAEAAKLVVRAFEHYGTGQYSLAELSEQLAIEGFVGRKTGNPLSKSYLRDRILSNPFYCGMMRYRGEIHPAAHTPVISLSQFERVQAVLHSTSRPRPNHHSFCFSGLLRCGNCGCAVIGDIKKQKYRYYRCSGRRGNCRQGYIPEEQLRHLLREHLVQALTLPEALVDQLRNAVAIHAGAATAEVEVRRAALASQERLIENKVSTLLELRLAGQITDEEYSKKRSELILDQHRVKSSLAALAVSTWDPKPAVEWFIESSSNFVLLTSLATPTEVRGMLETVGSNYQLMAKTVSFQPVEPFTIVPQIKNRTQWSGSEIEVRKIISQVHEAWTRRERREAQE